MPRPKIASAMVLVALTLGACAGPDVISASEHQIVLNAPDPERAAGHCREYGKSAQTISQTPLRITYACR